MGLFETLNDFIFIMIIVISLTAAWDAGEPEPFEEKETLEQISRI